MTLQEAEHIRTLNMPQREIAKIYGVSQPFISKIINHGTYSDRCSSAGVPYCDCCNKPSANGFRRLGKEGVFCTDCAATDEGGEWFKLVMRRSK